MKRDVGVLLLLLAAIPAAGELIDSLGGSDLVVILLLLPFLWHVRTLGGRLGQGVVDWWQSRRSEGRRAER